MSRTLRNAPRDGRKETRGYGCATCNHPEREAIDAALVAYTPLKQLQVRYGMTTASLSRHRSHHISKALVAIHPALPADATTLQQLEDQARRVEAFFAEAEKKGHGDQLTSLSRELRMLRGDIAKARGESGAPPAVIDVQKSAEWIAIKAVVLAKLTPAQRADLAARLKALAARNGANGG